MASDHRDSRRQAIDPLMDAAVEGVAAGYRGVEYVAEGLAESLRRRPGGSGAASSPSKGPGGHARSGREPGTARVVGEIAALTADLLDRLSDTAQEIAGELGARFDGGAEPALQLKGLPGETPHVIFTLTNTGPAALTDVTFAATDLIGAAGDIDAGAVDISPVDREGTERIRSGGSAEVCVEVAIPRKAAVGTYRGVITTRSSTRRDRTVRTGPRDAWAVLELEVEATDPRRKVHHDEEPEAE
jgi:hypothetical protein